MDPVLLAVGAYRVAGSLLVLRWPFWGGVAAVACDLFDLLLLDLAVVHGGWQGFGGYQAFDKWLDQVYLATFLVVAVQDFDAGPRRVAVALYGLRLVGFAGFAAAVLPREALLLAPNLFEPWFLAVAFTMRYLPAWRWTTGGSAAVLGVLLAGKLVQEWALHVARLFDGIGFLEALQSIRDAVTAPFRGR